MHEPFTKKANILKRGGKGKEGKKKIEQTPLNPKPAVSEVNTTCLSLFYKRKLLYEKGKNSKSFNIKPAVSWLACF